jgi:hypothetical protein
MDSTDEALRDHIRSFDGVWRGGYWIGDPLDPIRQNDYGFLGYVSTLYATYHACIRPYITSGTCALEIGCGRGAWTKTMFAAKEIWSLDALSPEHNGFWNHIGREHQAKVHYVQVSDFSCSQLPENHFDYVFSFGAFCHILKEGQFAYYRNLWSKLKPGANCFVMFADFDKFALAMNHLSRFRVSRVNLRAFFSGLRRERSQRKCGCHEKENRPAIPGQWYHVSTAETADCLCSLGYEVVSPDIGINLRDPVVHFRKPHLPMQTLPTM